MSSQGCVGAGTASRASADPHSPRQQASVVLHSLSGRQAQEALGGPGTGARLNSEKNKKEPVKPPRCRPGHPPPPQLQALATLQAHLPQFRSLPTSQQATWVWYG